MPRAKRAKAMGLAPCWKIRICMRGGTVIHALSKSEPTVVYDDYGQNITRLRFSPIRDTEHGDTIGHIDWADVSAITWRFAP